MERNQWRFVGVELQLPRVVLNLGGASQDPLQPYHVKGAHAAAQSLRTRPRAEGTCLLAEISPTAASSQPNNDDPSYDIGSMSEWRLGCGQTYVTAAPAASASRVTSPRTAPAATHGTAPAATSLDAYDDVGGATLLTHRFVVDTYQAPSSPPRRSLTTVAQLCAAVKAVAQTKIEEWLADECRTATVAVDDAREKQDDSHSAATVPDYHRISSLLMEAALLECPMPFKCHRESLSLRRLSLTATPSAVGGGDDDLDEFIPACAWVENPARFTAGYGAASIPSPGAEGAAMSALHFVATVGRPLEVPLLVRVAPTTREERGDVICREPTGVTEHEGVRCVMAASSIRPSVPDVTCVASQVRSLFAAVRDAGMWESCRDGPNLPRAANLVTELAQRGPAAGDHRSSTTKWSANVTVRCWPSSGGEAPLLVRDLYISHIAKCSTATIAQGLSQPVGGENELTRYLMPYMLLALEENRVGGTAGRPVQFVAASDEFGGERTSPHLTAAERARWALRFEVAIESISLTRDPAVDAGRAALSTPDEPVIVFKRSNPLGPYADEEACANAGLRFEADAARVRAARLLSIEVVIALQPFS